MRKREKMDNNNQNVYNYYNYDSQPSKAKNTPGLLSFIFALVACGLWLLSCCGGMIMMIPYIGWLIGIVLNVGAFLIFPLTIAAFICGIIGVNKKNAPKGLAVTGLIISIILIILAIIGIVVVVLASLGLIGVGVLSTLPTFLQDFQNFNY